MATGEKKPEKKKRAAAPGEATVEMPEGSVPFTGMQRAVSKNMEATLSTPIFRVSRQIEMDKFDDLYQKLKSKGVTVSALLAKAVALAIEKIPIINSSYSTEGGGSVVYNPDINIAMAVAIDGGLITPTLKYANERSIFELAENWKVRFNFCVVVWFSAMEPSPNDFLLFPLGTCRQGQDRWPKTG
jgi:pyruvate dehydrogenase E2 component (dihydrolipoamide acetyltransferase)